MGLIELIQAPPRRRESVGLRAATAAFTWAPSARPYLPPHHRTGLTSAAAKLLSPKALAVCAGIVAAAGIAVAATGNLPNREPQQAIVVAGSSTLTQSPAPTGTKPPVSSTKSSHRAGSTGTARPSTPPSVTTTVTPTSPVVPVATPPASPTSLVGLCQEWLSSPSGSAPPTFSFFIIAALGGVDGLDAYCANVLVTASGGVPSWTLPTHPAKPNDTKPTPTSTATTP